MELFPDEKACAKVIIDSRHRKTQLLKEKLTNTRWWARADKSSRALAYDSIHFVQTERKFKGPEDENDSPDLSEEDIVETTKMGKKFADNLAGK